MNANIENAHLLTDRFGQWPSFHDAEIISARFERSGPDAPYLELDIHLFEMTSKVDADGHYVLKNHTLARFRFCDIELEHFSWWNCQNAILDLHISISQQHESEDNIPRRIEVAIPAAYGCDAKLRCVAVKLLSAKDFAVSP